MGLDYQFIDDVSNRGLAFFWEKAKASGRLEKFFYDRPEVSLPDFIKWCRNGGNLPWFVLLNGELLAMCALNGLHGKTAWGHFCVLPCGVRRYEGMPLPIAVCVGMLAQWLYAKKDGAFALERVLGSTPATNGPALKAARLMGGHEVARVPGSCYIYSRRQNIDGIVTEHTRMTVPVSGLDL